MKSNLIIPPWVIWVQCIAFVILYAVWILPEKVGFRNTALVVGALASLYPIYQYRYLLLQKRALVIFCIATLFIWAVLHLLFLSQDYALQSIELRRIWRYAAIAVIFAFGLGLSLASTNANTGRWWTLIYFGLCSPVLIYLLKYILSTYETQLGIDVPDSLKIYFSSQPHYIPKSDYVAFCLPTLGIALGRMKCTVSENQFGWRQFLEITIHLLVIAATLFLFYIQDIKNGMIYSALLFTICFVMTIATINIRVNFYRKIIIFCLGIGVFVITLYPHINKNNSWRTLVVDTKIAIQLDKYQHWKYAGAQGYPNNEFGTMVSITNYERAAWFLAGLQLAIDYPLGFGLIEDSFKKMAKAKWPEVSPNLSHSHSGWLDLFLAFGFPGFLLVMGSLLMVMYNSNYIQTPWKEIATWASLSNLFLWCTTEVSATVTFVTLLFWIALSGALSIPRSAELKIL